MTASLGGFFEAMLPFLMGEVQVDRVELLLGPSPSGTTRLGFYQELTRRDRVVILQRLYPATRTLAERLRPGLFAELVRTHLSRHRSTHWEPNRFGEPFPEFVSESCVDTTERMLGELADYEWIKFTAGVELGTPIYFRTYDHDVVRYARTNLLVGNELREAAMVRVGVRARLTRPSWCVVREGDPERPSFAGVELMHLAGHPGRHLPHRDRTRVE